MSTPDAKEMAARSLRVHARELESALDGVISLSQAAWSCPAADALEGAAAGHATSLGRVAGTLRAVAASRERAAADQRAAETAGG